MFSWHVSCSKLLKPTDRLKMIFFSTKAIRNSRVTVLALILLMGVISCSKEEESDIVLPPFQEQTVSYFQEVALGFENGSASRITRYWATEMRIYVQGESENQLLVNIVNETVAEINELSTSGFQVRVVDNIDGANAILYLGSPADFSSLFLS